MSTEPATSAHTVDTKQTDAHLLVDEKALGSNGLHSPNSQQSSFEVDATAERKLLRKIDSHLLPILCVLYLLAFLDRVNIGNAKIQGLAADLHLTSDKYNVASMILFVPYILLEVPSNLIIKKIAPSTWLSGLMFFWGVTTMCQGFVKSYAGLIVCRVFLGIFEAGVFPGCAYLISMYYKRFELQKRLVLFFSSSILAGAFGGLLAYAIAHMNGDGHYAAWRWIFIIEGLVTAVVGFASKFIIVDWPETASFLTDEERALLTRRIAADNVGDTARMDTLDKPALKRILLDWKIWCGTLIYMCVTTTGYATNFFIPTILTQFGYTAVSAQVHTIPIYCVGFLVTLIIAWWSDRMQHRFTFTIAGLTLACIGYIILLCQHSGHNPIPVGVRYMSLFFIIAGNYVTQPLAVVWLANNMGGHYKRAFGSALQIGFGNIGGIIGSNIFLTNEAPYYKTGYGTGLALLILGMGFCTVFYYGMRIENRKRERGERHSRLELPPDEVQNLGDDHPEFRFNG